MRNFSFRRCLPFIIIFIVAGIIVASVTIHIRISKKNELETDFTGLNDKGDLSAELTRETPETSNSSDVSQDSIEPKESVRRALLVGIDDYAKFTDLEYAVADVELIRETLLELGFKSENIIELTTDSSVELLPTKANIEERLDALFAESATNDMIFIQFSGIGFEKDGVSVFAPQDARTSGDANVVDFSSTVSINDVIKRLEVSKSKFKTLIVDASRENPTLTKDLASAARALKPLDPPPGIVVLQSCGANEYSCEDANSGHGLFISKLVEALDGKADVDGDGVMTILDVAKYATAQTTETAKRDFGITQIPIFKADITDFVIADDLKRDNLTREARSKGENLLAEADEEVKIFNFEKALTNIDMALNLNPTGETLATWTTKRADLEKLQKSEAAVKESETWRAFREKRYDDALAAIKLAVHWEPTQEREELKSKIEEILQDPTQLVIPNFTFPANQIKISTSEELEKAFHNLCYDKEYNNVTLILAKGRYDVSEWYWFKNKTFAVCGEMSNAEEVCIEWNREKYLDFKGNCSVAFVGLGISVGTKWNIENDAQVALRMCRFYDATECHLYVSDNANVDARDCKFTKSENCGMEVHDSARLEMSRCEVHNCRFDGVVLYDSAEANVTECNICYNGCGGVRIIDCGSQAGSFTDNRFYRNKCGDWNDWISDAPKRIKRTNNLPNETPKLNFTKINFKAPVIPNFDFPEQTIYISSDEELNATLYLLEKEPNFDDMTLVFAKGQYNLTKSFSIRNRLFAICGETGKADDVCIVGWGFFVGQSSAALIGLDIEALSVFDDSYVTARTCRFHNCTTGLKISDKATVDLVDCEIFGCEDEGIRVDESACLNMELCKIHDCGSDGILLLDSATVNSSNSEIYNNAGGGVWLVGNGSQSGTFNDNRLSNNKLGDWNDWTNETPKRLIRTNNIPNETLNLNFPEIQIELPDVPVFVFPKNKIYISSSNELKRVLDKLKREEHGGDPTFDNITLVLAKGQYDLTENYFINDKTFAICGETGKADDVYITLKEDKELYFDGQGVVTFVGIDISGGDSVALSGSVQFGMNACRLHNLEYHCLRIDQKVVANVKDCEIIDCKSGIRIGGSACLDIRHCDIHDVENGGVCAGGTAQLGMYSCRLYNCRNGLFIDTNTVANIEDCELLNYEEEGIWICGSVHIEMKRSKIHDGDIGIHMFDSATANVTESDIYNNKKFYNVDISGDAHIEMKQCKVHNGYSGINIIGSATANVTESDIYNNKEFYNVGISGDAHIEMKQCKVHDGHDGIILFNSATANVTDCDIYNNQGYGVYVFVARRQSGTFRNNRLFENKDGNWDDDAIKRLTRIDNVPNE